MDLSIIIVNYNTFMLTCQCIESIVAYVHTPKYEIVLVDNASTECDPNLFKERFPFITVVRSATNVGFAKGNNLGINSAHGEVLLLLNSDTILQDDCISRCYDFLKSHPKIGAVTTKLVYPDRRVQSNCQRFPNVLYNLIELFRLQKFFPKWGGRMLLGPFFDYKTAAKVDWVWGAFMMMPKRVVSEMPEGKLFDGFFMYGEDMWWCWDTKILGYDVMFLPVGEVIHLVGASAGPKSLEMGKNRRLFLEAKYSPSRRRCVRLVERCLGIK